MTTPKKSKKAKKTTGVQKTLVSFLLDRSASMASVRDATIEAFNGYVEGLKDGDKGEVEFTFLQFDSVSIDKHCVNRPIKDAPMLSYDNFQPRGSTPLIDAIFTTVEAIDAALAKRDDTPKIVICIQTDGEENCSSAHDWLELNALIKEKTLAGWQFNFMGCGIDAYQQGAKMGITRDNTVSYSSDLKSTRAVFGSAASNTRGFADGLRASTAYTSEQKFAAGDIFDKDIRANNGDPAQMGHGYFSVVKPQATPLVRTTRTPARRKSLVDPVDLG